MFVGRSYQAVPQNGDSDLDTDNERAFFTNDSRKWKIGVRPANLSESFELDLPYVHPTIPVETKKMDYSRNYTRRQVFYGCCLMSVIVVMVTSFAMAIILGQMYIVETPPTNTVTQFTSNVRIQSTFIPTPSPLVNFVPKDGSRPLEPPQRSTSVTMATTPLIPVQNSVSTVTVEVDHLVTMATPTDHARLVNPSPTVKEMNKAGTKSNEESSKSPSHTPTKSHRHHRITWEQKFLPANTEASLELYDINNDGVMDVVAIVEWSPCAAKIVAMDGQLGAQFWQKGVNFPAFAIRCELDVNGDGEKDCLVTGRGGGFVAIDRKDGSLLWSVDPSIVFPPYNFYFPLIVDDLNNDGVDDIINMHGGDTSYKPDEHDRSPAYLVVISGKTGQSLIPPILTPDGHESYMSPVLFKLNSKDDLILFGSGGETVPGSLWAISLTSLKRKVFEHQASQKNKVYIPLVREVIRPCFPNKTEFDEIRPTFDKDAFDFTRPIFLSPPNSNMRFCPRWADVNPIWNIYGVCLYELVRSEVKGVMVPPVLVDLNLDSIDDLVVSTFDGHTIALNGSDATTRLWDVHYPNTESYSVPAPLYYNQDSIPDLMISSNVGEWNKYNNVTSAKVIDGRDGAELWNLDSTHYSMSSGLSIAANTPGFDAMLFFGIGKTDSNSDQSHSDSKRSRRHGSHVTNSNLKENKGSAQVEDIYNNILHHHKDSGPVWISTSENPFPNPKTDFEGFLDYCGESTSQLTASLWLVTREMVESGAELKPIASHKPFLFTIPPYLEGSGGSISGHTPTKRHGEVTLSQKPFTTIKEMRCIHVAKPIQIVGTPVIGDFNLDGHLEVSYGVVWSTFRTGVIPIFKVFTFTLEDRFSEIYRLKGQGLVNFDLFLPSNQQPWNRYMGHHGNNTYTKYSN